MRFSIELARKPADFHEVFAFRYLIYVEEMNRKQKFADHLSRIITDPLDELEPKIFVARDSSGIIGTVRTNRLTAGNLDLYENLYSLPSRASERRQISMTSRLMVKPAFRSTSVAVELAKTAFCQALRDGVLADYIDCNDHLVGFFSRLGYRPMNRVTHPEYGSVQVMRIHTHDLEHLERVRSPFLCSLQRYLDQSHSLAI